MIKSVIFDIDNTMYDFDAAHKAGMLALGAYAEKHFGMGYEETDKLVRKCMDIVTGRTGDNCAALHNRLIRFQCFLEEIGLPDYPKALEMYHIYWGTVLEETRPEPGLLSLLSILKQKGIRIGVGTDMTAYIQYKKLEKLGALPYLDFIVTSEEAGVEKPTPGFFALCLKKAGCRPEECVFIGDNVRRDVEGSTKCGMKGTWYNPGNKRNEKAEGYPVIHSFEEYIRLFS